MTLDQAKIILDLGEKNNIDDIRKAYRKKALQYHPDRYQTFSEQAWATKKFIKIKLIKNGEFFYNEYNK